MDSDKYLAIEKFANGLRECYQNRLKDHTSKDNAADRIMVVALNYALDVLGIHLDLARLEFESWANDQAKHFGEDR